MSTHRDAERYFVAHMQKTAGTTLRDRLRASFTDDEIYPNAHRRSRPSHCRDLGQAPPGAMGGPRRRDPAAHGTLPGPDRRAPRRAVRHDDRAARPGRPDAVVPAPPGRAPPTGRNRRHAARGDLRRPVPLRSDDPEPHDAHAVARTRRDGTGRRRAHEGPVHARTARDRQGDARRPRPLRSPGVASRSSATSSATRYGLDVGEPLRTNTTEAGRRPGRPRRSHRRGQRARRRAL